MGKQYELVVAKSNGALYIASPTEALIVDERVRGTYLHKGTPILDIFYRDCQHALSLHFESADDAKEVFAKVKEYLLNRL